MRTVGVEEEYLLVDPDTGRPRAVSHVALAAGSGAQLTAELQREQLESATRPCATLAEVGAELRRARAGAARAAQAAGADLAALATSPLAVEPTLSPSERYREMGRRFGLTVSEELTCGCHVHVGIDSDDEGVGALDRIRPWLPPLLALTVNSPFWQGGDSGYASYRSQVWQRWPSAGPYAPFGSPAGYHATVQAMIDTDTLLDPGMVYFDARLSVQHPTLEVRVGDVCLDVDDAVLLAALVRGLVETAARAWRAGVPADPVRPELLRLASWRAGRSVWTACCSIPAPGARCRPPTCSAGWSRTSPRRWRRRGISPRCGSGSARCCAAARGRGRNGERPTREAAVALAVAPDPRLSSAAVRAGSDLCSAGPLARLPDREPDQPDDDEPEHDVADRAEPALHPVPVVAEDPAQPDEDRVPHAAADRGEQQETGHGHAVDPGRDRDDAADQRDAAAEQHHLAAVLREDLLAAVEVLLARDEEPAACPRARAAGRSRARLRRRRARARRARNRASPPARPARR